MISAPFEGNYQQYNSFDYQNQAKASLDKHFINQGKRDSSAIYDDHYFDQWLSSQLATEDFGSQGDQNYLSPAAAMQSHAPPSLYFTGGNGRNTHQRESSLSSLGSMGGPASPYAQNTTNPQIAVTDSSVESFHNMQNGDINGHGSLAYYPVGKTAEQYNGYQTFDPSVPEMAYPVAVQGPNKLRHDRGLLPAPDAGGVHRRSRPTSVTSSNGGDSPATPNMGEPEQVDTRRRGRQPNRHPDQYDNGSRLWNAAYGNVPKFDRTMTDVYSDELYSPNFTILSSSPTQSHTAASPSSQMFSQRLNAANNQHSDYQNQMLRMRSQQPTNDTPKTISPKDAMLDFNESDGNQNFSLFPQNSDASLDFDPLSKMMGAETEDAARQFELPRQGNEQQSTYGQLNMDNRIPQQYPFVPRPAGLENEANGRMGPDQASPAEHAVTTLRRGRPASTAADGGTYTCTYHGCSMRFESPSQLQKHKREGHRQMPLGLKSQEPTLGNVTNTQAGPHRCDRINPSTGKPCNSIFSRPYDLTRHEDTIHNARKLKVQCDICTEEKTFSRADALTRHYRVCHPEMELPGKHRRRAA